MKNALVRTICQYMEQQNNIYILTGDLGYGVLTPICNRFPDKFINLGICEQNMASVAAGMAMEGNIVFIYSIANFPTLRCLEQIRNDIAYNRANVKIVSVGGGFAYGSLGMSHHATEDISIMRAIPNIIITAPADPNETIEVVKMAININGPVYIRIGRGGEANICCDKMNFKFAKAIKYSEGSEIVLLSTGTILNETLKAKEILKGYGINPAVYSIPIIKPFDIELIKHLQKLYKWIVTIEEQVVNGGLGGAVAEILSEDNGARLLRIGIKDKFINIVGSPEYLRQCCGLDSVSIAEYILKNCVGINIMNSVILD